MTSDKEHRVRVAVITMGDPAGCGPFLIDSWIRDGKAGEGICYIIVGSRDQLKTGSELLEFQKPENGVFLLDAGDSTGIVPGKPQASAGTLSFGYLKTALELIAGLPGSMLVTLPVCKKSWELAGIPYTGHTEVLKDLSGAQETVMFFMGRHMNIGLSTTHLPLKKVPESVDAGRILRQLRILSSCGFFQVKKPKIGLLGLNPHNGEGGLLGSEEVLLEEAIRSARQEGIDVFGPLVPDAFFHTPADCYLALYHDQGLIPFKLLHGISGVHLTLGLPFCRVSVTHGTAFDRSDNNIDRTGFNGVMEFAAKILRKGDRNY
ncbi:MAG: 4-hydroxythreonine-4-phosphate dehydrogenase PdxA [Candidatus Wallbacteria bacterium]|nr:4-hydroxythreonine-4-phosphate dehydrogenase PdxA [Candidatus Wallbacteria bacterium]